MSAPYHTGQVGSSDSPYRPSTADSAWEQSRPSTMGEARSDFFAHTATGAVSSISSSSSQFRSEPLLASQPSAISTAQTNGYLDANVITPRQGAFPRDQMDAGTHFSTPGAMDTFDHGVQHIVPTDTPRAAPFGTSGAVVGAQHSFAPATSSGWPSALQQHQQQQHQPQSDSMAYSRYAYPSQTGASSWASPAGMSMSHSVIYDSSSSANTSPNRSQTYYDMSSDHFDHSSYASHMGTYTYPTYGPSTSKIGTSSQYMAAPQPEYQPEEIDSMLNQVSTLYKTANTKKMAEFYRDKWARMWLTCNYTLKPSIQISIPRTILHESYRRACDSFGLEPLQAASFGKVLRSQFPDVAQRRLGGRGKTRFHYCGFGTSNEREAVKVKSLLEDEKAGKLQLSAGLSAEYAAEARAASSRSDGHEAESSSSSYRTQPSSEASPGKDLPRVRCSTQFAAYIVRKQRHGQLWPRHRRPTHRFCLRDSQQRRGHSSCHQLRVWDMAVRKHCGMARCHRKGTRIRLSRPVLDLFLDVTRSRIRTRAWAICLFCPRCIPLAKREMQASWCRTAMLQCLAVQLPGSANPHIRVRCSTAPHRRCTAISICKTRVMCRPRYRSDARVRSCLIGRRYLISTVQSHRVRKAPCRAQAQQPMPQELQAAIQRHTSRRERLGPTSLSWIETSAALRQCAAIAC